MTLRIVARKNAIVEHNLEKSWDCFMERKNRQEGARGRRAAPSFNGSYHKYYFYLQTTKLIDLMG